MRFQRLAPFAYVFGICLCFFWGCQGNKPLSPSRNVSLSVFIPPSNQLKASLLGVAQNEVTYRVDGPGHVALAENTVGPLSISANYGSVDFTVDIPQADNLVLSVQLNDAVSHQPLALGAVGLNLLSSPVSDVVVEMGSVTRTCYTFNGAATTGPATILSTLLYGGFNYDFDQETVANGTTPDIVLINCGTCADNNFDFQYYSPPLANSFPVSMISYLGNGNLVDYDYVPPDSAFATDSNTAKGGPASLLAAGDIFCFKLLSLPGAHAWVQITDPATPTCSGCAATKLPSFRYRINDGDPYYGYYQSGADVGATCAAW